VAQTAELSEDSLQSKLDEKVAKWISNKKPSSSQDSQSYFSLVQTSLPYYMWYSYRCNLFNDCFFSGKLGL